MANNFGRVNVSITASTGGLTAGLSKAGKQLRTFRSSVSGMSGVMSSLSGSMGMMLPVLGGFATVGGAIAALTSATQAASALHDLSQEVGVAGSELQVLQQVAAETGASQEAVTTSLRRTARMVGELAQGTPAVVNAFGQLGLTMQDMAGLSTAQQFQLIAERIASLPSQMQAAAAFDIFGRSGQGLLNFIRQLQEATPEVKRLQEVLGVSMSDTQLAAIEAMGDAISRLSMPMQGFINQFLSGLAPAITAVSQILLDFSVATAERFSFASAIATGTIGIIRVLIGTFTVGYGVLQMFSGALLGIGSAGAIAFGFLAEAIGGVLQLLGQVIPALAGIGESVTAFGIETQAFGDALAVEAQNTFMQGVRNFENPLQNFDARMAQAQQDAANAALPPVDLAAKVAGQSMADAIASSTKDLKAVVVGSSDGESFRNAMARGADPRFDVKEDAKRTADGVERSADSLDEIASLLGENGTSLASIMV